MENTPDDPGFFLNDLNIFILISALGGNHFPIVAVSVHDLVWNIPLRKAHLLPQPDVTGNAAAFFLCNGCQCRKDEVAGRVCRIQIFFLEQNRYPAVMQDIQCTHKVSRVSGKS